MVFPPSFLPPSFPPLGPLFTNERTTPDVFSGSRLIDDLLAPYSLETSSSPHQAAAIQHNSQQQHLLSRPNFRNPQPYYPYRRPSSALADPFVHSNNSTPAPIVQGAKSIDPLRQQNRERIQPLHIRSPFANDTPDQPRPTHRTFSEPNTEPPHTLDILSTSLYDPNSPYYTKRQSHPQQNQPQSRTQDYHLNNNNFQKSYFSDSDDFLDDDMNRTTANWKNSFAAMRDRFGSKEKSPDESKDLPFGFDYSFASNGSLTMPRSRGLLKSASQSTISRVEPSRASSLLREAVNRRASEAPDLSQNGSTFSRRSSETPEPTAKKPIGNFWIDTVKNRPTSPSIPRLPFKMTTAAERLEQLHEPLDSNIPELNQDYYPSINGSYNTTVYRKSDSIPQRRNEFTDDYSPSPKNNGFRGNST